MHCRPLRHCRRLTPLTATPDTGSDTEQRTILETTYPCVDVDKTVAINGNDVYNCSLPCTGTYTIYMSNSLGEAAAENGHFVDDLDNRLFVTACRNRLMVQPAVPERSSPTAVQCSCSTFLPATAIYIKVLFTMSTSNIPARAAAWLHRVQNSLEAPDAVGSL